MSNVQLERETSSADYRESLRVLICAENVSMQMGGEASLPFYYFKLLRARQVDTYMICHARVRDELRQALPDDQDFQRIRFIEDTQLQVIVWQVSNWFPHRIKDLVFGQWLHVITQRRVRVVAKKMIHELGIQAVFEPSPITPKGLSFMYNLGVPVAIGPLCGGLEFPPAFRYMDSSITQISVKLLRFLSPILHQIVPGKIQAETLIVANQRTADALPQGCQGKVYEVVESGVDLSLWQPAKRHHYQPEQPVRFVYSGRFVDWKGIEFLIEAFKLASEKTDSDLELIGDGELRGQIEAQVAALKIQDRVKFHGWMSRENSAELVLNCDVFVMPSLRECGGTALLEAMAMGLPVIATKWAGPATYVDPSCGVLVEPASRETFIHGLANAMIFLAQSPELRHQMGDAGQQHVMTNYYDWDSKVGRMIEILKETLLAQKKPENNANALQ